MAWLPVTGNMNAEARDRVLRSAIQGSNRKLKAARKFSARLKWELSLARQELEEKGEELEGFRRETHEVAEQLVALSLEKGMLEGEETQKKLEGMEELLQEKEGEWQAKEEKYRREISWLRGELGRVAQQVKVAREGEEEKNREIRRMRDVAAEQTASFRHLEKAAMLMQKHDPEGHWNSGRDPDQEGGHFEARTWKEVEELQKQLDSTLGELSKVRKQLEGKEELILMTEHRALVLNLLVEELQKETGDKDGLIKQFKHEVEMLKGDKLFLELRLKEMTDLVSDLKEGFEAAKKLEPAVKLEGKVKTPAPKKKKKKQLGVAKKKQVQKGVHHPDSEAPCTENLTGGMPIIESTFSLATVPKREGASSSATPKGQCGSFLGTPSTSASSPTRPHFKRKPKAEQKSGPDIGNGDPGSGSGSKWGKPSIAATSGTDNVSTAIAVPGRSSWTQFRKTNSGHGEAATSLGVALKVGYPHRNRQRHQSRLPRRNVPARIRRSFHHAKDPSRPCHCLCGKKYREEKFLWNHVNYYSKLQQCSLCQLFFQSLTSLNRHMVTKHYKLPFTTVTSNKAGTAGSKVVDRNGQEHGLVDDAESFQLHLPPGNGEAAGPSASSSSTIIGGGPTCRCICGKQYPKREELATHLWLARQRGIFRCSLCPPDRKPFILHSDLKMHVRNVHKMRYGDGRFACCICASTFQTRKEVASHRREVHGLVK